MKEYWEKEDRFRGAGHPVVETFVAQRIEFLRRHVNFASVERVLDVGCGSGISAYYLQNLFAVTGLDNSKTLLHKNSCKNRVAGSAYDLPFKNSYFDLAYAWEVLHHLDNPLQAVAEMKRVSRRYLVLIEPNRDNIAQFLFALLSPEHRLVFQYSRRFLDGLVNTLGLHIIYTGTIGWIFPNLTPLPFLPILSRLTFETRWGISNVVICEK